jgi:hypothetical protein
MKIKLNSPAIKGFSVPSDKKSRPAHLNAISAAYAAELSEVASKPLRDSARFGPFGFRINVKPGRIPQFRYRVLRK